MKKYSTWLQTASVLQLIAALIHTISLFVTMQPKNETEKQLFALMDNYRFDFGAGFHRTMSELTFALSACFCLVCLLGSLLNWYLLQKKLASEIMQGVITINLLVFGILFGLTIKFAFLLPIILSGLIFLSLLLSRFTMSSTKKD
ncbi:MAG: hypothetical protein RLZZ28_441 [Bacteroidota bacterium]|jgi:hypothetical protein